METTIEIVKTGPGRYFAEVIRYYPVPGRYVRLHTTREAANRNSARIIALRWMVENASSLSV
jgi:hypothetical protein